MTLPQATIKKAWPYQQDRMKLPVENLEKALPFYTTILGFQLVSRSEVPFLSAIIERDGIQLGLAENGGDPTQDGCFFEVDDVEKAFAELQANGFEKQRPEFDRQKYGEVEWKVFFVVAPDGLCYCFGERHIKA
ncbi:VOC family protein [Salmonirosea aquatica]|uniref:VOC family protein n=1 Tax=Salmonirosea aquatica TaxID=2654236 RepID=A0A7C9BJX9_9BACT|nr:VOC family protein [Cytophagaceae bacterium SJW1-29]